MTDDSQDSFENYMNENANKKEKDDSSKDLEKKFHLDEPKQREDR